MSHGMKSPSSSHPIFPQEIDNEVTIIKQLLTKIQANGVDITDAKICLLKQFKSLTQILSQSTDIVLVNKASVPVRFRHSRALIRLIFSSLADTFERYLADLLIEIHYAQPDTLKSESSFTAKEILDCTDENEIISLIANRKVGELPKGNSNGFGKYLKRITKIDLFLENETSFL